MKFLIKSLILKRRDMSYQLSPENKFDRVVRFQDQKGVLGVAPNFLLEILNFYQTGSSPPQKLREPEDYNDFSQIGMLIICKPELEPYLQILKYVSLKWYNIIERWDLLISHFFYQNELSNDQLNDLLMGIMNIPQPNVNFCWSFDDQPKEEPRTEEPKKEESTIWMNEMKQNKKDFFVIEEPSFEKEEPSFETNSPDSHSLIEEGTKEIVDQLSHNLNALNEMEITSETAKLLIPIIIRKFNKNVNLSWSWTSGKEDDDAGWQDIYTGGDDHYDIPHQTGVVGHLEINLPISPNMENKGMIQMFQLMRRKESRKEIEEQELSATIALIKELERSGK